MIHENDLGFQIHNLSNLLGRYIEQSSSDLKLEENVSRSNVWIISYLAHHSDKDIFQKDIENTFSIRKSTVSKVIGLMEEKGYLCRKDVDYDARLKKLVLTEQGWRLHSLMCEERKRIEKSLRQNISEDELQTFFLVIEKIKNNIR